MMAFPVRLFTALAGLFFVLPAAAQDVPVGSVAPPAAEQVQKVVAVVLSTSKGNIVLALDETHAPVTVANFLKYVDERRFDGIDFYRSMRITPDLGLIQAGTRYDPRRTLPKIAHEPTSQTGLSHTDGVISMARLEPGSAAGDFFITIGDLSSLDANPAAAGDNAGFAAFGHVAEGMDVVHAIMDAPTSPTEGEGVMKGQMLEPVIHIETARRVVPSK